MAVVACAAFLVSTTTAPVAGAAQGEPSPVLRIPFPQEDGDLNPYGFELGYPLMMLVYDSLLWRDESGTPQPWLAASVDQSADRRQVTLRLASDVRFHDGAPLTAEDVAFSFRYFADHRHPRFTAELAAVAGVRVIDSSTVIIGMHYPAPGFVDQPLADLPILPAHLWRDLPAGRRAPEGLPIGSGPYRLVAHEAGKSYRFEANDEYFRGRPSVGAIEVPIISDADGTLRALEARRVDMVPLSLPPAAAERVRSLGIKAVTGVSYVGTALTFNLRRPPFDSLEARQAVAKALDIDRLADVVGGAVPADRGYLHPESAWASPDRLYEPNQNEARAAGRRLGLPPLTVLAPNNDPVAMDAARQVAQSLQGVGISAQSKNVTRDELSSELGEDGFEPSFDLAVSGISPLASYDPDFLRRMFGPDAGILNPSGYRSQSFDEITAGIATTADSGARRALVSDALRQLATDLPGVPLLFPIARYTFRPAIYDRWVFVRGTGILDKRSFVAAPTAATASTSTTSASPIDFGSSNGGTSPIQWAVLGLGLVMVIMLLVAGQRWWRSGP